MDSEKVGRAFRSQALRLATFGQRVISNVATHRFKKLDWQACAPCPETRTEAVGAKIGQEFLVIGGYQSLDRVLSGVDVFNFEKQRWTDRFPMPPDMPQTHMAIASDEDRFVYFAGGQLGAQCHPARTDCFVLDVQDRSWSRLPPLRQPRYAATMQLWGGRLHLVSGAKPDRWSSAYDHWSLAVSGGRAVEDNWREETSALPKGGPHRTSAIYGDKFFLFGGQDGDLKPVQNDPSYTCDQSTDLEKLYPDCFSLEKGSNVWTPISPMPAARTHSDAILIDHYAVMAGGNEGRRCLSDLLQVYDIQTDRWRIAGRLPYPMKTAAVYHDAWLYLVTGQRSKSRFDLLPGQVVNTVLRARFDPRVI